MAATPRVGEGLLYDPYTTFRPSATSLLLSDNNRELVEASLLRVELDVERDSELPVSDVEFNCVEESLLRVELDVERDPELPVSDVEFDRAEASIRRDEVDDEFVCDEVDDDCDPEPSVSDVKLGTDSFCALCGGSPANKTTSPNP